LRPRALTLPAAQAVLSALYTIHELPLSSSRLAPLRSALFAAYVLLAAQRRRGGHACVAQARRRAHIAAPEVVQSAHADVGRRDHATPRPLI
jgi:hypothetical protein